MKVITILQPFATLIALGEKHFETRSWKTDCRGPILIHAGKGKVYMYLCEEEPFRSVLEKHGYTARNNLPLGEIIARANLIRCIQVGKKSNNKTILMNGKVIKSNEYKFGDYSKGRYAWQLEDVQRLRRPIPVKGQQRLWNYRGEIIG